MLKTKYKDEIINFYQEFLDNTSINSSEAVAWSSRESQYARFKVLLDIGITESDTFLDLGCGLGHMVDYMKGEGMLVKNYTGIDINQNYVLYALHRNPGVKFLTGEIYDVTDRYDYIVGSGIFTVRMPLDEILAAIDKAFELCNKGVAFNFLNKDYLEIPEFNSFVPEEFHEIIKKRFSKTKLTTDYLINEDFTIYIYK
jgi:cyclopropane fatty-acyl-phospholipid synthase-like methyltransferase